MQDPSPMPWGAMDRYQAHFIVRGRGAGSDADAAARTVVSTSGRFGAKRVAGVSWDGAGRLAEALNADADLNSMIAAQRPADAAIFVEPMDDHVRIRGGWSSSSSFSISRERFDIYDRIAGHVRAL